MLLLDTYPLLWLASDPLQIPKATCNLIGKSAGRLFVSSLSVFEMGIKYHKKLLALPLPPAQWFQRAIELHGLTEIPVDGQIAATATELPQLHNDPLDRIMIATAMRHDLTIVTPNTFIQQYPDIKTTW